MTFQIHIAGGQHCEHRALNIGSHLLLALAGCGERMWERSLMKQGAWITCASWGIAKTSLIPFWTQFSYRLTQFFHVAVCHGCMPVAEGSQDTDCHVALCSVEPCDFWFG